MALCLAVGVLNAIKGTSFLIITLGVAVSVHFLTGVCTVQNAKNLLFLVGAFTSLNCGEFDIKSL